MKKIIILIAAALLLASCTEQWNDLVHEEVVANINKFEIEGQVSSAINTLDRTVLVKMPSDTDLRELKISAFAYTEGAELSVEIKEGDVVDLSQPLEITLTTYDPYVWTITATSPLSPGAPVTQSGPDPDKALTKDGPQVYNMGFDLWSKHPDSNAVDVPYGASATDEQKAVWGSTSIFITALGLDPMVACHDTLAVSGSGKAALRLKTNDSSGELANGLLYTGKSAPMWPFFKDYDYGTPFTARPVALEGYALYKPRTITMAQDPYLKRAGTQDIGQVLVVLSDWDKPYGVEPPAKVLNYMEDPGVIGYGKMIFNKDMNAYERFQINIIYLNDRTPKYVTIVIASSALGDYGTGGIGSVLYMDELAFLY